MSSVTRRVQRGLRYEMVPKLCTECEAESRVGSHGLCATCFAIGQRDLDDAEAADEEANG